LALLVTLIPRLPQFLPLFEFPGIGRVRKAERLQVGIGAREPCFGFVQRPDNFLASYIGYSAHTKLDGWMSYLDSKSYRGGTNNVGGDHELDTLTGRSCIRPPDTIGPGPGLEPATL
jgi:hypothetical protein